MWDNLDSYQKEMYKKFILTFASLTEIVSQNSCSEAVQKPYINYKFQETAFQRTFKANIKVQPAPKVS